MGTWTIHWLTFFPTIFLPRATRAGAHFGSIHRPIPAIVTIHIAGKYDWMKKEMGYRFNSKVMATCDFVLSAEHCNHCKYA